MEEDYFEISAEESRELNELGITYRWRDRCLPLIKEAKLCGKEHTFLESYYCKEVNEKWRACQLERERKICETVNLKPVMKPPTHLG